MKNSFDEIIQQIMNFLQELTGEEKILPMLISLSTIVGAIYKIFVDGSVELFVDKMVDRRNSRTIEYAILRKTTDESRKRYWIKGLRYEIELLMVLIIWWTSFAASFLATVSIKLYVGNEGKQGVILFVLLCGILFSHTLLSRSFRENVCGWKCNSFGDNIYISIVGVLNVSLDCLWLHLFVINICKKQVTLYILIVIICVCMSMICAYIYEKNWGFDYQQCRKIKLVLYIRYAVVIVGLLYGFYASYHGADFSNEVSLVAGIWMFLCCIEFLCTNTMGDKWIEFKIIKEDSSTFFTRKSIYQLKDGKLKYKSQEGITEIEEIDEIKEIDYFLYDVKIPEDNKLFVECIFTDTTERNFYSYNYLRKDWIRFYKYENDRMENCIVNTKRVKSIIEKEK